jgi:hypothetical protein
MLLAIYSPQTVISPTINFVPLGFLVMNFFRWVQMCLLLLLAHVGG